MLPKGVRSDASLNIMGTAILHVSPDGASAAYHIRLPKSSYGAKLETMLQQLASSARFQADVVAKGRMTVDDSSIGLDIAVHCFVTPAGLITLACTRQDYPTRIVFPKQNMKDMATPAGLLGRLADVADDDVGIDSFVAAGPSAAGTVRRIQLAERVAATLERVCADYEDAGKHDSVSRVQAQVDEARDVMHGNINALLANQEQLTQLQSKTDDIAHDSRGFYRDARASRRQLQCTEFRNKMIGAVCCVIVFFFFFGGWIFGGDDDHHVTMHIPPSPPPPDMTE